MNSDLTFITNEKNKNLKDRFEVLIKDTAFFDCLVGYFYSSGFHALYKSLEKTEKVRILIGISTNPQTFDLLNKADEPSQRTIDFSHAEAKEEVENLVEKELADSEDNQKVEEGVNKFIEWVRNKKLEIRAYPSQNIHAKVYIMTFAEGDRDIGRVITGSSNFTEAGLKDNLEFNVELKNRSDYDFAKKKFDELWSDAVDVSEKYIQTIQEKTWLSQNISPYQLYLKFLYEYFKDELSQTEDLFIKYLPQDFKRLAYQEQAVLNAKKILQEYGGVFISDVVGLGKTYISAMLAGQLDGRTLVIAPPVLLEKTNPGSWPNVFSDFRVQADFESLGKLDHLLERGVEKYTNIIIDEAHRFRTETTMTFEKLAEICRGKRVILVTATPYNNSPKDILSLLKLFQKAKRSTIPNLPNLEGFFNGLYKKIKDLDRQRDYAEYIKTVKENSLAIREKVLKYLMVRRTRTEIEKYFEKDITEQKLRFPEVEKPTPFFYELNEKENEVFDKTIELIAQKFKYARYMPMLYYEGKVDQLEQQSQKNMGKFMKILLVKRLESSFFAFRNSVDRFVHSYDMFIKEFDAGNVYVSKKHTNKIFEMLEDDNDEAVQHLIDEGKAQKYPSSEFRKELRDDLQHDYEILLEIKKLWQHVERDPKLIKFLSELSKNSVLKENHLIIFTESKETADYLYKNINNKYPEKVLCYTGDSGEAIRDKVIANFDARARNAKEDYRILVSTEVLAEGVNLHRSNTVINYDIPWNPTRMMQRVGRVNRVDTSFDTIYTFNFFPTQQSNDQIKLKEAAESKINAFLTLLGGDAELLTEGEPIGSHELFNKLISKQTLEGENGSEESDLKYLNIIKEIREKDPTLFEKIKRMPRKARTSKVNDKNANSLITYFRRGKLQKFYKADSSKEAQELDFISAAKLLESETDDKQKKIPEHFYSLLNKNKEAFILSTTEEMPQLKQRGGRDSAANILRILKITLKNTQKLTEDQEQFLKKVFVQLEEGGIPKKTAQQTLKALESLKNEIANPLKVVAVLQNNISQKFLEGHFAEQNPVASGKREVILSLYLAGE
ncbi:MAG TPA: helicase-related protein [Spirochaetota bacterium]|nr:helicase-related protein [Spirochaetota bacterium]